jgi:hypothetical protein
MPMQTPRAHRSTELAKELARQGHEVTIYAVIGKYDYTKFERETKVNVKHIPLKWQYHLYSSDGDKKRYFIDKVMGRLLGKKFDFPNIEFKKVVKELVNDIGENYDVLISIADPHQIHWGCALAKKDNPLTFPKVWIADCGDPYMKNKPDSRLIFSYEKYERLFCEYCEFITVPVKEALGGYFPEYHHKFRIIPQGFNFSLSENIAPNNACLSFAFAGTFYKDLRNPSSFLALLANESRNFKFYIFTWHNELVKPFLPRLKDKVILKDPIPRVELIEFMKTMDFLVNIDNVDCPNQVPSKLIDYGISGRPILNINPQKNNEVIVGEFLERNYQQQLIIENLNQYHITNVANQFLDLCK